MGRGIEGLNWGLWAHFSLLMQALWSTVPRPGDAPIPEGYWPCHPGLSWAFLSRQLGEAQTLRCAPLPEGWVPLGRVPGKPPAPDRNSALPTVPSHLLPLSPLAGRGSP